MESSALIGLLEEAVPGVFEAIPSIDLQTTVYAPRERVVEISRVLRDRPELRFEFLAEVTAVDYWPREPRFELVYLLVSKRLFGLRGGRKAYDAERRGEQLLDIERAATTT